MKMCDALFRVSMKLDNFEIMVKCPRTYQQYLLI
jgi:hypothetical protein